MLQIPPLLAQKPTRPWTVGIIGAGAITNAAHIPAYLAQGWKIRGIFDVVPERALETAKKFSLSKIYVTLDEILKDPSIKIIDVAVPPSNQIVVAQKAVRAGKHVLCQEPLAEETTSARRLVQLAATSHVQLAVNQQMRWTPAIRAVKRWLEYGVFGTMVSAEIQVNISNDWGSSSWLRDSPRLDLLFHSIHYLDSLRYLFGEPNRIYAEIRKIPGQVTAGETRTLVVMSYEEGPIVFTNINHCNWSAEPYATFRFEGTDAIVQGTLGLPLVAPYGQRDPLRVLLKKSGTWESVPVGDIWLPDAFAGPMGELMLALEEEREPLTSGRDNIKTLQIVHAAYTSAAERRAVIPWEL